MTQTWDPKNYAQNASFVPGMADEILKWLDPVAGERILDLGCGDGQLTARIAATGASVVGVDASPEMLAAARARGIDAYEGNAESLPFADRSFDAVFSNAVLHWVRGQDAMMDEVRRVLKPSGRFVAEMGGYGNIAAINVAFRAVCARHADPGSEDTVNYFPTPQSYAQRLSRHGFQVDRILLIPRPTPLAASGMDGWLRTFRRGVLNSLREELRETVIAETCALLAPALRDESGNWTADYVRLRFIATIPNG
jgi:SAM-dependent methyltransferase